MDLQKLLKSFALKRLFCFFDAHLDEENENKNKINIVLSVDNRNLGLMQIRKI